MTLNAAATNFGPATVLLMEQIQIMADLTDAQKLEIVEALACFQSPSAIITHFQSEYGLEIDHKQVGRYDPHRSYFAGGEKWRTIFEVRRTAFLDDASAVPVAHKGYRLQTLQRGVEAAQRANNWPLAANLLEQAAKEVGGALTNQRELRVDDNRRQNPRLMSPEDQLVMLEQVIAQAMAERKVEKGEPGPLN